MGMVGRQQTSTTTISPDSCHRQSQTDGRPTTPFKRSRSKVFYGSDSERSSFSSSVITTSQSPISTSTLMKNVTKSRHKEVFGSSPSSEVLTCLSPRSDVLSCSSPKSDTLSCSSPVSDVLSSPGSEVHSFHSCVVAEIRDDNHSPSSGCSDNIISSNVDSPGGSLRGSPSHGSQDSGYSDSGESHSGGPNDSDEVQTTPHVKHITRVYFGDLNHQTKLFNDKIVCTPECNETYIISGSESTRQIHHDNNTSNYEDNLSNSRLSIYSTSTASPESTTRTNLVNSNSKSTSTIRCNSDYEEIDHFTEHKSLSMGSKNPTEQKKFKSILRNHKSNSRSDELSIEDQRKTGAIKKSSLFSASTWGRRHPRRSKSIDKLQDSNEVKSKSSVEIRPRRNVILKAKRRWSSIEIRQPKHKSSLFEPNSALEQTSPTLLPNERLSEENEEENDKRKSERRLRIHPLALAKEMK